MKEATRTARIENWESLYLKILNHLGLSDVKVLPFPRGFQLDLPPKKWTHD